jgi:hypothetical protein
MNDERPWHPGLGETGHADIVPAEVYELRPEPPRAPGATVVMAGQPAFVARISTSLPLDQAFLSPAFEPVPSSAPGRRPGVAYRRVRLGLITFVALCSLGAIVVGYAALTRTATSGQAQGPRFPGAPLYGTPSGNGPPGTDPVAPLPGSAGPSASATVTGSASVAAAPATHATTPATAAAGSASAAASVADATPASSALALRPPAPPTPSAPAGSLDATLTDQATSTADGLARYTGTIVLANSGAADVSSWSLTLTVPGGNAVLARGPVEVDQDGESVEFTPAGGSVVPAGGSFTFTFGVRGILSDLPDDCAINGRPCS